MNTFSQKKYLKELLVLLGFLVQVMVYSQSSGVPMASIDTDMPEIAPPSPTVAALMKFEEIPVDNYTGIPNISLPLYSIETMSKDLKMDVSLKYHPASIAVKETAAYTGLGWNLLAGGTVSRTVRGMPDEVKHEGSVSGYNASRIGLYHSNLSGFHDNNYYEVLSLIGTGGLTPAQRETIAKYSWYSFEKGILDSEHDLYQFNFMGHTGRFYIKMNTPGVLQVVKLDNDNSLKIEFDYTYDSSTKSYNFLGFTIYDDKGYKYVFAEKEVTKETVATHTKSFKTDEPEVMGGGPEINYASSFHLSEIYDNNNKLLVELSYVNSTEAITDTSFLEYYIQPLSQQTYIVGLLDDPDDTYEIYGLLPKRSVTYKFRSTVTRKLSNINIVNKARIAFTLESGREDTGSGTVNLSHKLKTVTIKDWWYNNIKKFDFTYGYSTINYSTWTNKRLILEKVSEKNFTDSEELVHEFSYKWKNSTPGTSYIDYWGYYKHSGNNREPDPLRCMTGVLEKMTLPTGGHISFNYESNTYRYIGDELVTDFDGNPDNWNTYSPPAFDIVNNGGIVNHSIGSATEIRRVKYVYTLTPASTNYSINLICLNGCASQTVTLDSEGYYILEPNKEYGFQTHWPNIGNKATFTVTMNGFIRKSNIEEYYNGGGIRIKNIDYYEADLILNPAKSKYFNYNDFGTTKTSGALVFPKPIFEYSRYSNAFCSNPTIEGVNYLVVADYNNLAVLRTKGSDVGYRNVTVYEGAPLNHIGYTQYTYKSPIDEPEQFYTIEYPFLPSRNYDHRRGLLTKEKVFEITETSASRAVSEATYVYEPWSGSNQNEVRTGVRGYNLNVCAMAATQDNYGLYVGCITSNNCPPLGSYANCSVEEFLSFADIYEAYGWAKLQTKTTKNYFYEGSTQRIVQTTENFEFNSNNKRISYHSVTNSLGETLKTDYYYDTNHASRNRIGVIKKIEDRRNSTLLETKQINYANNWQGNNAFLPQNILVSKATNTLEPRIQYMKYDEYSNPLEVKQENGIHIVYLWGYHNAYPVAKIENMEYSLIPASLITAIQTASNNNNESALLTALTNLRNNAALASAMVTTYTYKPLVGVTTITDPRGYKTTYQYDNFGRLKYVRDADGNILEEHQYHYRP